MLDGARAGVGVLSLAVIAVIAGGLSPMTNPQNYLGCFNKFRFPGSAVGGVSS